MAPAHGLQPLREVQTALGSCNATHGALYGNRPVSLYSGNLMGKTQPFLQQLGEQEAHIEASATESLREGQGEATELEAWNLRGLSREVGEGRGLTADWLACWQEHPAFIGIPFRDTSATLKTSQRQVGVSACEHKEVTTLAAAFLQWWATYVQTQTIGQAPGIL